MSILNEKIAICQFCSGITYRESALNNINNFYKDGDNLYYFIITDDKEYFKDVKRKNFYVNELKDFYKEFPLLEQNEPLIYAKSRNEYAKLFVETNYKYSFSLMRLHLLQALEHSITNVVMMCTDSHFHVDKLESLPEGKDRAFNCVSEWDVDSNNRDQSVHIISNFLKKNYDYTPTEKVRILDAAGRFFRFSSLEKLRQFFNVWNHTIEYLYESGNIDRYRGSYVINDEYILAPIYNMFDLNIQEQHAGYPIFTSAHGVAKERFWSTSGQQDLIEHVNYEEFLKLNNLIDG